MRIKTTRRQSRIAKRRLCLCVFFAIVVLILFCGTMSKAFASEASPFPDVVTGDWYCDAVLRAKCEGILEGYPDGNFRPQGTVTYAEFLRMAIKNVPATSVSPNGHWAIDYYNQGIARNLFTEYEIRTGSLDEPIPRKYMALVFAGLLNSEKAIPNATFSDIDSRSAFEYYVAKSAAAGLLVGYPDGTFHPEGVLTRAEAATAFVRLSDTLASYDEEEAVPVGDISEGEKISDIADPFCLEYLNNILKSVSFSGSNGMYKYYFSVPSVAGNFRLLQSVTFFSPSGKNITGTNGYWSRDSELHIVEMQLNGIKSLAQIGSVHLQFAITPLNTANALIYSLWWDNGIGNTLRIEYQDTANNKYYSESSKTSLEDTFKWE